MNKKRPLILQIKAEYNTVIVLFDVFPNVIIYCTRKLLLSLLIKPFISTSFSFIFSLTYYLISNNFRPDLDLVSPGYYN